MQKKHQFFVLGVPTFGEGGGSTWLGQNPKNFQKNDLKAPLIGAHLDYLCISVLIIFIYFPIKMKYSTASVLLDWGAALMKNRDLQRWNSICCSSPLFFWGKCCCWWHYWWQWCSDENIQKNDVTFVWQGSSFDTRLERFSPLIFFMNSIIEVHLFF